MFNVEDHIKSNVRERIKGLPAVIHRVMQSISPPRGFSESESTELAVPENFDPNDLLADIDFDGPDAFDFNEISNTAVYTETSGSSGSSSFSDSFGPMPSSNTSVEDEAYAQFYPLKSGMGIGPGTSLPPVPEHLDYNYVSGGYL